MKLLEDKIEFTKQELQQWFSNPDCEEQYFQKRIDEIQNRLKGEGSLKSIFRQFDYLNIWYGNNFIYNQLTNKKLKIFEKKNASNGYETIIISNIIAQQYPNNPPKLVFEKVSYWLANVVIQKWYDKSRDLIDIINQGLYTKFLKGGLSYKPTAWFIITIVNKGFNMDIDYSEFKYPKDLGVYQEALDFWNSDDLNKIDSIVSKLCDFHLEQAIFGDPDDNLKIQFSRVIEFVHIFEILSWLSIREMIGLQNPTTFSHPLMHLPLNSLPENIEPIQLSDLFIETKTKLELT